mgnify:CR=1 FL=1
MRILLLFCLLASLPLSAQPQEATGAITTETSSQQDAAIATRMREILTELGNYGDVTVSVNEGIVTLRGTATSAMDAQALVPLATRIEGMGDITDRGDRLEDI